MTLHSGPVIFIDDDDDLRAANIQSLQLADLEVQAFGSARTALTHIDANFPGVVVSDIRMPDIDGHQLFSRVRAIDAEIPVILISGHVDVTEAMEAIRRGAYDFIVKPYSDEQLAQCIKRALEKRQLVLDNRRLRTLADEAASSWPLIGQSPAMERLRTALRQLAEADVDTLIEGETGAGKELAARALHNLGPRRRHPFVAVNCGALPAGMVESELFGHELGAFPGAARQRIGRIEFAHRGTLFLDEIEAMPPDIQVKLLRFCSERELTPLGSNEVRTVDVRIVTAAKGDLESGGVIRPDLLHRLKVAHIIVPPLRERRSDIPLLFAHFLARAADRLRRPPPPLTPSVQLRLAEHSWPGNVRELANYAERYALGLDQAGISSDLSQGSARAGLKEKVDLYEAELIREALAAAHGDVRRAIETLHLPRETFYAKARKHGIDLEAFRTEARAAVSPRSAVRQAEP